MRETRRSAHRRRATLAEKTISSCTAGQRTPSQEDERVGKILNMDTASPVCPSKMRRIPLSIATLSTTSPFSNLSQSKSSIPEADMICQMEVTTSIIFQPRHDIKSSIAYGKSRHFLTTSRSFRRSFSDSFRVVLNLSQHLHRHLIVASRHSEWYLRR